MNKIKNKVWQGRFTKSTNKLTETFTASINIDKRLYVYDIIGSIAHTKMLARCKIISTADASQIITGLNQIKTELETGKIKWDLSLEDVHMNIENMLVNKIGTPAKKMHTGRSRNDQVILDLRLFLRDEIILFDRLLFQLNRTIYNLAGKYQETPIPGYTHLQPAQPVFIAQYLMAYYEMFTRDRERFKQVYDRVNVMPLGAAALAGPYLPIDRHYVAKLLDFPRVFNNSIDVVSDRDFVIEFLSTSSLLMLHLSRLAEELIIWSSVEFAFIKLDEQFCTGSSFLPQKKNPDVLELVRGKTGRVYGALFSLLTVMKGLPLAYNKDMQEDKESVFDTVDTVKNCLTIIAPFLAGLKFKLPRLESDIYQSYILAPAVANFLVKKGLTYRESLNFVGIMVSLAEKAKIPLQTETISKILTLIPGEYKSIVSLFTEEIKQYLVLNRVIKSTAIYPEFKKYFQQQKQIIAQYRPLGEILRDTFIFTGSIS